MERERGNPLGTWRRTIEEEMKAAGTVSHGKKSAAWPRIEMAGGNLPASYASARAKRTKKIRRTSRKKRVLFCGCSMTNSKLVKRTA